MVKQAVCGNLHRKDQLPMKVHKLGFAGSSSLLVHSCSSKWVTGLCTHLVNGDGVGKWG